jgi:hypothetical protein
MLVTTLTLYKREMRRQKACSMFNKTLHTKPFAELPSVYLLVIKIRRDYVIFGEFKSIIRDNIYLHFYFLMTRLTTKCVSFLWMHLSPMSYPIFYVLVWARDFFSTSYWDLMHLRNFIWYTGLCCTLEHTINYFLQFISSKTLYQVLSIFKDVMDTARYKAL